MCGIAGYIGLSKDPRLTYQLSTAIFNHLETRGTDAAGIWGVESGNRGSILYHKEPIKSSEFVDTKFWEEVAFLNPDLLLLHARATSPGVGHASYNRNNHPFVTSNKEIGLIHNGNIHEFEFLKYRYETKSDTDSEVLLRIIESTDALHSEDQILEGFKNIWSVVERGHMAMATGQRTSDGRRLYLTRNDKRPLWMADLTECLGQMFFFSSLEIWYAALRDIGEKYKFLIDQKLAEIPVQEIWFFETTGKQPRMSTSQCKRYRIKVNSYRKMDYSPKVQIPDHKPIVPIITRLDDKDNVEESIYTKKTIYQPQTYNYQPQKTNTCGFSYKPTPTCEEVAQNKTVKKEDDLIFLQSDTKKVDSILDNIETCIGNIRTIVHNNVMDGSVTTDMYDEIVSMLEQTYHDLEGTETIIHS